MIISSQKRPHRLCGLSMCPVSNKTLSHLHTFKRSESMHAGKVHIPVGAGCARDMSVPRVGRARELSRY